MCNVHTASRARPNSLANTNLWSTHVRHVRDAQFNTPCQQSSAHRTVNQPRCACQLSEPKLQTCFSSTYQKYFRHVYSDAAPASPASTCRHAICAGARVRSACSGWAPQSSNLPFDRFASHAREIRLKLLNRREQQD